MLKTILIFIVFVFFIIFIVEPILFNIFKLKMWDFIKEELEKDAEYKKMVKEMIKGKK